MQNITRFFLIIIFIFIIISCSKLNYGDAFYGLHAEIWSERLNPGGDTYEIKVGCKGDENFLVNAKKVTVTFPNGIKTDTLINEYNELKRFAIHGPENAGFPPSGKYLFNVFLKSGDTINFTSNYQQGYVDCAKELQVKRQGEDLYYKWTPPDKIPSDAWIKLLLYGDDKVDKVIDKKSTSGTLSNAPLTDGQSYQAAVGYYYNMGWSKITVSFTW